MPKMNVEIGRRWVEALRSGEYEQARDKLRDSVGTDKDGFCCLGVLCDLYDENGWDGHVYVARSEDGEDREPSQLPEAVAQWAGLDSTNPRLDDIEAATHNDGEEPETDEDEAPVGGVRPKSFSEIADLIEQYLLGDDDD